MKLRLRAAFDQFLIFFISYLMVYSLIVILSDLLWYRFNSTELLGITLIIHILISLMFINQYTFYITLSSFFLGLLCLILLKHVYTWIPDVMGYLAQSLFQCLQSLIKGLPLASEAQYLPITSLTIALVLYIRRYMYGKTYLKRMILLGLIIFSITMITQQFDDKFSFILYVISLIFYFFYDFYFNNVSNKEQNRFYGFSSNLCLFAVLVVGLALLFNQVCPEPLQWVENIEDWFENIGKQKNADGLHTFSSHEALIETFEASEDILFEVKAPRTLYLRGEVCDTFDGQQWLKTVEGENPTILNADMNVMGLYILEYGLPIQKDLENQLKQHYFYKDEVTVTYKNISTKTVFTSLNTFDLDAGSKLKEKDITLYHGENYSVNQLLSTNTSYSYTFLNPRYGSSALEEKLMVNAVAAYENYHSGKHTAYHHSQSIEGKYLQIHETMTDRTRHFAQELTEEYETPYEKAKAIEQHLRKNYQYAYNTALPKEDRDTLDYFLFETKKGFCTYYATAMVLMLRSLDIPARFVKGFIAWKKDIMDEEFGIMLKPSEISYVKGKDAHAWVEVYLEGFGWISFEPTPGFTMSNTIDYRGGEGVVENNIEDHDTKKNKSSLTNNTLWSKNNNVISVLIFFGLLILIVVIIKVIHHHIKCYRYKKLSNSNRIRQLSNETFELLKLLGIKKLENKTLREFALEVDEKIELNTYSFVEVVKVYEVVYYTVNSMKQNQIQPCETYYKELKEHSQQLLNKFQYHYYLLRKY